MTLAAPALPDTRRSYSNRDATSAGRPPRLRNGRWTDVNLATEVRFRFQLPDTETGPELPLAASAVRQLRDRWTEAAPTTESQGAWERFMQEIEAWLEDGQAALDEDDVYFLVRQVASGGSFRRSLAAAFGLSLCQDSKNRKVRTSATESLGGLLNHPSPDIRLSIANFLGQAGERGALPFLLEMRHDDSREVRAAVASAIAALRA